MSCWGYDRLDRPAGVLGSLLPSFAGWTRSPQSSFVCKTAVTARLRPKQGADLFPKTLCTKRCSRHGPRITIMISNKSVIDLLLATHPLLAFRVNSFIQYL